MTEQEVWPLATEIWEKREKIELITISVLTLADPNSWHIALWYKNNRDIDLDTATQVRRFLDGLE